MDSPDRPRRLTLVLWAGFLPLIPSGTIASDADEGKLPQAASRRVDYERDIRPIFAKNCYRCHGPQKQRGGLGLHAKATALAGGDGGPVLEAGKSEESRLIRMVAGLDDEGTMPPEGAGKPLSPEEIGLLRAWIDQGLAWPEGSNGSQALTSDHWAFQPPRRPDLPRVRREDWPLNPIDGFILARLEKEGLRPSPEADRTTLIRRLSLDLIGLPPTVAEVDAFRNDPRPDAYERLVDRLLASPHYGERWGRRWLDRARYADTNGYEKDRERSIWPYRDWVIRAINQDKPFDQFTVEQIAGDLLPGATLSQKVATGFHRNTMINEEGGIDVEEFRFASLVDRVATTGTVWLGLTIQCAQCHTHKYDPITQREYYQFLAFLDNADEPELDLPSPEIASRRAEIEAKAAALEADLENQFPTGDQPARWQVLEPSLATSSSGATLSAQKDGSILVSGPTPESDTYTVVVETKLAGITALRLEALTDPTLPSTGPGRTPHGNFVLSELRVTAAPLEDDAKAVPVALEAPLADFSQSGFDVRGASDGDPRTGWAIDDLSGHLNKNRSATFPVRGKLGFERGTKLVVTLDQRYGGSHVLGRFRLSARRTDPAADDRTTTLEERRRKHLESRLAEWEKGTAPVHWTPLKPTRLASKKHATLTVKDDLSILASGDKPNNDTYEVDLDADLKGITALRLEVLPDPSLPDDGPGRAPLFSVGDFILTEFSVAAASKDGNTGARPVGLQNASQDYSEANRPAALAIDGVSDTGWTVKGGIGRAHAAVFEFKEDVGDGRGTTLHVTLRQDGIHQMTIGRFRISATTDRRPVRASGLPTDVEEILLKPADRRAAAESLRLKRHFLSVAPELAKQTKAIADLRRTMPRFPTSMVMQERAPEHARTTQIHKRGEFLKTTEPVTPGVPAVLPPLPQDSRKDRLALARWLVDASNPMVGRVIMNQSWQAFFGRGLVSTVEDFGTRGERPTHPELLDWLATEFTGNGWSMKAMHRLIVASATYRQDSRVTPDLLARDPKNELLARGPRFRVEAEVVRDIALTASGLLNAYIGGPSVYPPQPDGVTSLAYGQVPWTASKGADRYRRGLYTFTKRTAPYAAFTMLDAPTSETTCVRRERSNTPLQALTLLNDTVFVEASRAMARRVLAEAPEGVEDRASYAFRLALSRQPRPEEVAALRAFHDQQLARFRAGEADPAKVAGLDPKARNEGVDAPDLAAWTTVARALLNLDETITKE